MSQVNMIAVLLLLMVAVLPAIAESQCKVSEFRVQRNFDIARFQGRWFIHKKFTQSPLLQDSFTNREHIYTKGAGEDLAALSFGRCHDGSCQFEHGKLKQPSPTGSNAAKLGYQPSSPSDPVLKYWVIDTDYESYALIYGCNQIKQSTGKCMKAYSWILERTRQSSLSQEIRRRINRKINGLCLKPNDFEVVSQTGERCRQCDPSTWTVQPNFDLDRYLGLWHEMVFKPRVVFPRELAFNDYLNVYTILPNGTIAVRIVRSDPALDDKCFITDDRQTWERTDEPGKFIFFDSPDRTVFTGDDYFVIETDYTGISFVLGCVKEPDTPDGECVRIRGSVWSRKPYFTSTEFIRLKVLFDQYCLDEQEYYITTHNKICPREPNGKEQVEVCVLYDKPDVCLRGL
ncbi:uncharacterized protein LOC135464078 [Liolophura sinensis]|uniref:uncharacterized protein LOC135464078 n=1 Tax=Liolophura sinensis TaxID=3198878 RepID=UPI003158328F